MKNAFLKTKLFLMAICAVVIVSCSGDDGEDGTVGPQGIAGIDGTDGQNGAMGPQGNPGVDGSNGTDGQDGATGAQGPAGQDGEDGNAEVIYSAWIPANFIGTSDTSKYMDINFPSSLPSASSIKNSYVVLVYFTGWGDGNAYLLPILNFRGAQFTYGFGSFSVTYDIRIYAQSTSTATLTEYAISPDRGNKFRYVIIPPSILATGKSSIDYSDYETVKTHYNLPD